MRTKLTRISVDLNKLKLKGLLDQSVVFDKIDWATIVESSAHRFYKSLSLFFWSVKPKGHFPQGQLGWGTSYKNDVPHPSCLPVYRNNDLLKLNEFIYESIAP